MKESECKRGLRELKMGFSENEFDVSQVHAGCPKVSKGNENVYIMIREAFPSRHWITFLTVNFRIYQSFVEFLLSGGE